MVINKKNYSLVVLFLVITIDAIAIGFVWPIFGALFTGKNTVLFASTTSMQWRNILCGVATGTSSLVMFLAAPIVGNISDYIGRRRLLLFCLVGTGVGMGISIFGVVLKSFLLLIFSRIWLGITVASQIVAKAAIIDSSSLQNKASRLGILSTVSNLGFIVGPIIGGLLIDKTLFRWFSFTTPFYFAAILALLNAYLLFITYREIPGSRTAKNLQLSFNFEIFVRAFAHKSVKKMVLLSMCLQVGWVMYLQTIFLTLIQKYNYSGKMLGYFLFWFGIISSVNLLIIVRIIIRVIPPEKIAYFSFLIAAICSVISAYSGEFGLWIILVPISSAISLGGNAIITAFSNLVGPDEQGWVMGISKSITALAWGVTPMITGFLLAFGCQVSLFLAAGLLCVGAFYCKLNSKFLGC